MHVVIYMHEKTLGHIVLVFKVALSRTCILLNVGQVVGNVTRDPQNYILIYDFFNCKKKYLKCGIKVYDRNERGNKNNLPNISKMSQKFSQGVAL